MYKVHWNLPQFCIEYEITFQSGLGMVKIVSKNIVKIVYNVKINI